MSDLIDLAGLDKADVLAALYNASHPQGMGFLHYDPAPMTREQAAACLEDSHYFDYLKGRVMKIDLAGETLNPRLYDRDNGDGAAARALASLRAGLGVNPSLTEHAHAQATQAAATEAQAALTTEVSTQVRDGAFILHLGLADVAEDLAPAIRRVLPAPAAQPEGT